MFGLPPLPRNPEAALRDLGSSKPETRKSALVELVTHASHDAVLKARAVPELIRLLSDENRGVRSAAAVGLADLGSCEAVMPLLLAVEDDDAHVREMALSALGELGDTRALARIERALDDERPEVRYQATIAFVRLCDDGARRLQALQGKVDDDDRAIRYIALRLAEEYLPSAEHAAAVTMLAAAALDDAEAEVRCVAALLLAQRGDRRGLTLVDEVVREGSLGGQLVAKEDEAAAVELVGTLGHRELIPVLERRAFGVGRLLRDTCAMSARIALARLGHPRAMQEILRDLTGGSADRRTLAVVAVGRSGRNELRAAMLQAVEHGVELDADLVREALAQLDAAEPSARQHTGDMSHSR